MPTTLAQVEALFDDVRQRGMARVVDTLLAGVVGFCAPVFDSGGHLVLGITAMGTSASFDSTWKGRIATPLKRCAQAISARIGQIAP